MTAITVLVVDGDDATRGPTVDALETAEMSVLEATSVESGVETLISESVDCVVTEYTLPDGSGLDVLSHLRETSPDTPCLLYTGVEPAEIDTTAFERLVVEYLPKAERGDRSRLRQRVEEITSLRTQVGYPLPDDEDARLAALAEYDITDLDVQATFDRLTQLAARHFGVDRAFIGLVHEHDEEFVSCNGGEMEPLPRESTMCTYAILEPDIMVVEDVRDDDRFEHNEALKRRGIRSYAGAPIRTPEGQALGSFCLTDGEVRQYTSEDREYLRLLADEATEQLQLRRRLQAATEGDE